MTLAQAQAIALAVIENELEQETAKRKHGSLWAYELQSAAMVLRQNRKTDIEARKMIAKRLISETNFSFREIARQSKLHHSTVALIWRKIGE